MEELVKIQSELNCPKNQRNNFGGYNYRSCEDILEAAKSLLNKYSCTLTLSDDIVPITDDRVYIKATATITNKQGVSVTTTAFAREELTKKGMDASQITGATSSYARKYALNGLFCIDDVKDADATNKHGKEDIPAAPAKPKALTDELRKLIGECTSTEAVTAIWKANKELQANAEFKSLITTKGTELKNKEGRA